MSAFANTILPTIKLAVREISNTFDDDLISIIDASVMELANAGIHSSYFKDTLTLSQIDPQIKFAVRLFCLAHFGLYNADSDKYQKSYDSLKATLCTINKYTEVEEEPTEPIQLTAPTGLEYDELTGVLSWIGDDNASDYGIQIGELEEILLGSTDTEYNIQEYIAEAGSYLVQVRAIADSEDYTNSEYSTAITIVVEDIPQPVFPLEITANSVVKHDILIGEETVPIYAIEFDGLFNIQFSPVVKLLLTVATKTLTLYTRPIESPTGQHAVVFDADDDFPNGSLTIVLMDDAVLNETGVGQFYTPEEGKSTIFIFYPESGAELESDFDAEFTTEELVVLSTPAEPEISGDTVSFSEVSGADEYRILVGDTEILTSNTSVDLSIHITLPGTYSVTIQAKASGTDQYEDSLATAPIQYIVEATLTKLATPTLSVSEWNDYVYINYSPIGSERFKLYANGTFIREGQIPTGDIKPDLAALGAGSYNLTVVRLGDNITTSDSDPSNEVLYTVLPEPLDTPTNLYVEDNILYWDEVPDAFRYEAYLNGGETTLSAGWPYMDLFGNCQPGNNYNIQVKAFGLNDQQWLPSELSAVFAYNWLSAPSNSNLNNDVLSYDAVANADSYKIYVDEEFVIATEYTNFAMNGLSLSIGEHTVHVRAYDTNGVYSESPASSRFQYIVD